GEGKTLAAAEGDRHQARNRTQHEGQHEGVVRHHRDIEVFRKPLRQAGGNGSEQGEAKPEIGEEEQQEPAAREAPAVPGEGERGMVHGQAASLRCALRPLRATKISSSVASRELSTLPPQALICRAKSSRLVLCMAVQLRPAPLHISNPSSGGRLDRGSAKRSTVWWWPLRISSRSPLIVTRPSWISVTWSQVRSISCSRWEENTTLRPSPATVRMMASMMSRRTTTSSPLDGSSSMRSWGRCASAPISAVCARMPCDS